MARKRYKPEEIVAKLQFVRRRCCRDWCWNSVTRSPVFREYRVRPRGQLADRWMFWQAFANRQPFAC